MFTGIITETGVVAARTLSRISIRANRRLIGALNRGMSISVDGACLTTVARKKDTFSADIMTETARKTSLAKRRVGDLVNLELPATPSSFLAGHIVQGHVDGIGTIQEIRKIGSGRTLKITVPRSLTRHIVYKGSIAVNGISLTVIEARKDHFTVGIIPHTWSTTNLRAVKRGDKVNLEADVLAKYAGIPRSDLGEFLRSDLKTSNVRIGIIGSSFRENVTAELEKRCIATLRRKGVPRANIDTFRVPGSMEIPLVAKKLAAKREYDALITFGAIVKGKTYHFEQIASECARGCMNVSLQYEIPVIFEVLAVYDIKDAMERATRTKENKGIEAAESALSMIRLMSEP